MIDALNSYNLDVISKGVLFFASSLLVMLYYYTENWLRLDSRDERGRRIDLLDYLFFNHPERTYDAVKRVALVCIGSGVLGMLDVMTNVMVLSAGAAAGYTAFANRESR